MQQFTNPHKGKDVAEDGQSTGNFFASVEPEKGLSLVKWFGSLSLPDKSIVLTTVDKRLVNLIVSMLQIYRELGNGKFTNSNYPQKEEVEKYKKVK